MAAPITKTFKEWCIENGKTDFLYQWSPDNEKMPDELGYGSHYKAKFVCDCGNEYSSIIHSITARNRSCCCQKCSRRVISEKIRKAKTKDKQTLQQWCRKNKRKDILKQWSKKNDRTPKDITAGSSYYALWVCDKCGYEWQAYVGTRISQNTGCPCCLNKKVAVGINDLETWCKQNNMEHLLREWDYKKNAKLGITPQTITAGSAKKVWWKFHDASKSISIRERTGQIHKDRMSHGSSRAFNIKGISFPEKAIAFYFEKYFDVIEKYKPDFLGNSEIDIYIPSLKMGIEYDGSVWHNKKRKEDIAKYKLCKKNDVRLIRVRDHRCVELPKSVEVVKLKNEKTTELQSVIISLLELTGVNDPDVDVERDRVEILKKVNLSIAQHSLKTWCEENGKEYILDLWHKKKNGTLTPEHFSYSSTQRVWWKCKHGHEWQTSIDNARCRGEDYCPICSNRVLLTGYNDLESWCKRNGFDYILDKWDYELNDIKPSEVLFGSRNKVWWKKEDGTSTFQSVDSRTGPLMRKLSA